MNNEEIDYMADDGTLLWQPSVLIMDEIIQTKDAKIIDESSSEIGLD